MGLATAPNALGNWEELVPGCWTRLRQRTRKPLPSSRALLADLSGLGTAVLRTRLTPVLSGNRAGPKLSVRQMPTKRYTNRGGMGF